MSDNTDHKNDVDDVSGTETTGHEWDGIKELNTPLPRWWLIIFYATIIWSLVYWVFMPAWPGLTDSTKGLREHSERKNVTAALEMLQEHRAERGQQLLSAVSLDDIEKDPELFEFAMSAGNAAFGDNCATCHGAGGAGVPGYPNLNDDVWLWGGSLEEIRHTITYGIRANHPETRMSIMPAFGDTQMLGNAAIKDMVEYVFHLSGHEAVPEAVERAGPVFEAQCAACHGADGTGDQMMGAPNLTDQEWLFAGTREAVYDQIYFAENAMMPNWGDRLEETTIASLAVYVHSLGGGE